MKKTKLIRKDTQPGVWRVLDSDNQIQFEGGILECEAFIRLIEKGYL